MELPEGTRGALVIEVVRGGPADKAGLRGSAKTAEINGHEVKIGGDVIIAIDDNSLEYFTKNNVSWPWPRDFYAIFTNYLTANGAENIIFDLIDRRQ